LLTIKVNQPKLVTTCGYKMQQIRKNSAEISLTGEKVLQKDVTFLTHTVGVGSSPRSRWIMFVQIISALALALSLFHWFDGIIHDM